MTEEEVRAAFREADARSPMRYATAWQVWRDAFAACEALATPAPAQPEGQSADVDEMAAWMRRLVRALRKAAPGNALAEKALDDLKLRGLLGDVLREAEEPNPLNVANERGEGWQPIETAPKDGTWLLLAGSTFRTGAGVLVARWNDEDWESADDGYPAYVRPTHWMPLPAAPKGKT